MNFSEIMLKSRVLPLVLFWSDYLSLLVAKLFSNKFLERAIEPEYFKLISTL